MTKDNTELVTEMVMKMGRKERMMNEMININTCAGGSEKPESAKTILGNMDAILKDLENELIRIDDAIYSTQPREESAEQKDGCMLETLIRHRKIAEDLLKLAIHIRDGLF